MICDSEVGVPINLVLCFIMTITHSNTLFWQTNVNFLQQVIWLDYFKNI